ncbi:GGDEF domain-containing protein [Butyrivibrio sp. CB08]|uniref:GGDEF domain-containing protein n=1 Tax=Butyrivibrio sp. CB08 TaxID=2364879 RepID=UPI000EAA2733|nr:GGDEF domain-containing protein [Butyrivibrio sp. CB08]RKM61473.1 GGDEF domain-containing protein [Butyrivibrio sp. CB08]
MRLVEGIKDLVALYHDYKTMNKDEKADFYQAKCDYYQKYVELSLIAGCFSSVAYIFSDYLLNGTFLPTLVSRCSIIVFMIIFFAITHFSKKRSVLVFMDYFLGHAMVIATIWSIYHLEDKVHASEGFIIMNLIWITVGFVAKPREVVISTVVFLLEIILTYPINHYPNLDIILALEIPCGLAVILSHCLLMLYFLDHYRIQQKLELAMITDPLTQVYNRHLLERIVYKNALRDVPEGQHASIAMLDIDFFKKINDEHGHYTGDLTLLYIGQKLSGQTHDDDYVIRYGGEEFVIIFKNCDVNHACARMEQFRQEIENAKDTPVPFTVSIGVSHYNGDYSKTIQNVDAALYKAKNTGRNKVVVI